ncbi:MAG: alanine--tRNA ligase [Johnsonella sp.]|nr:alanine--tRNA ligase [Johnsonella sp.]
MSKNYGVNEIRKMFLDFFRSKDHLVMKSFSLIPYNDNSLLLINSGMAPLKPYFTGQEIPPKRRVATCQKCIRTGDIDNVGKTARHGTFFEMLGNFSFGDYFKREAIEWTWEFLTKVMELNPERLYPSVYVDDDEAFEIWNKEIKIPKERIFKFGKADNFWEHGSGPCGPCSEVYYDRGEKYGCKKEGCTVGCDCDRYIEVWNNVFTQFDNDGKGNYTELENKNIDTGMGLERLAVVSQDVGSIFEVDTVRALLDRVAQTAGISYQEDPVKDVSLRLITDHIRSCTFMISDGIMPSNEGRGYVLRRLLRRAARHGRMLGIEHQFLADLAKTVIDTGKDGYPELEEKRETILKILTEEENKFYKNIDLGLSILAEMEERMREQKQSRLCGEDAFKLYDTYGFPLDLTREILAEKGYCVDEEGFDAAMKLQKETARKARKTTNYMGADITVYQSLDPSLSTEFTGYDRLEDEALITALTGEEEIVESLEEGSRGTVLTDRTPFYATMGGQIGDIGRILSAGGAEFIVEDTIHLQGEKIGHIGYLKKGRLSMGEKVGMKVERSHREAVCKNHSATHLLHKVLKEVLGNHVEQAGSLVAQNRLRFDFTHFSALSAEDLKKIEELVNREIKAAHEVCTRSMELEAAKKEGATALFGEKYQDIVRVVNMGEFSMELCGGTHVKNTGDIAVFKILSESGIAAGIRRIEAITGEGVLSYYEKMEKEFSDIARELKTSEAGSLDRVRALLEEVRELKSENESLKSKLAKEAVKDTESNLCEIEGVKFLALRLNQVEMNELRNLGDQLKEKTEGGVIVLASVNEDKVNLIAMAGEDAVKRGADAGGIIRRIAPKVGGGGGGKKNMAQAGGKDPEGVDEALALAGEVLKEMLLAGK